MLVTRDWSIRAIAIAGVYSAARTVKPRHTAPLDPMDHTPFPNYNFQSIEVINPRVLFSVIHATVSNSIFDGNIFFS